jgi:predicted ATPase
LTERQFFLQMSGVPGSGKSTVAVAVAQATHAVIIDHDVTKSALLDAGVPGATAGKASYAVLHALARHLLVQGKSVIFDSPCFYTVLLDRGVDNLILSIGVFQMGITRKIEQQCVAINLQA